ncbi:helix-turn-helix domain-containing protein [Desulfoscipio gibsoniae]
MKKDNIDNLEKWRPMATVADYLGVSRETVLQWIEKKGMPAHKVGRQWKFKISEIDEWIRSGEASDENTEERTQSRGSD